MARTVLKQRFRNAEAWLTDQPDVEQLDVYCNDRWVQDPSDGQYKTFIERDQAGDLDVECATVRVRGARVAARFEIGTRMRKLLRVEEFVGGSWQPLTLTLAGHSVVNKAEDLAVWRWRYELPDGTDVLGARLTVQPGSSKWDYAFRAPVAGRYRLRIAVQVDGATAFEKHQQKVTGADYQCYWRTPDGTLAYNWRDMLAQVANVQADLAGLLIASKAANLAAGEVITLDPTVGPLTASWGADVQETGSKYANDGSDWVGYWDYAGGFYWRVGNKFDISSLSASATVTQVDHSIGCNNAGGGSQAWSLYPYNGTGQGNPETDAGTDMFTRCGTGTPYVSASTAFRTTGLKTFTALGSAANSHVESARDAGTTFSLGWKQDSETTDYANLAEYTDGTNPPKLTITYTTGTTYTKTATLNAAVQQTVTKTAILNAAVQQNGLLQTATINAAVQTGQSLSATLNAAVQVQQALTAAVNAAVQDTFTKTATVNAAVEQTNTLTAAINAQVEVVLALTATLNAAVQDSNALSTTLNAAVQTINLATATLNAAVAETLVATCGINGAVQITNVLIATANAYVDDGSAVTNTLRVLVGAYVREYWDIVGEVERNWAAANTLFAQRAVAGQAVAGIAVVGTSPFWGAEPPASTTWH